MRQQKERTSYLPNSKISSCFSHCLDASEAMSAAIADIFEDVNLHKYQSTETTGDWFSVLMGSSEVKIIHVQKL